MSVPAPNPVATYCDPTDVMAVLRLQPGDIDATRVSEATQVAAGMLRRKAFGFQATVWPLEPDAAWAFRQANIIVAVEEYRRPGIAFGLLDQWADVGPIRVGSDPLAQALSLIMPYVIDWGIG